MTSGPSKTHFLGKMEQSVQESLMKLGKNPIQPQKGIVEAKPSKQGCNFQSRWLSPSYRHPGIVLFPPKTTILFLLLVYLWHCLSCAETLPCASLCPLCAAPGPAPRPGGVRSRVMLWTQVDTFSLVFPHFPQHFP